MFYQTLVKRFRFEASPAERSTTFYSVARHVTLASWLLGLILLVRVHSGLIPSSALYLLGLLGTLWGTHCLYRQRTDTRHLAVALGAIAILLAAGAAAGAISQLGLRLGNPFIDATLARADREIGFHSPTVIASLVQLPLAPQVLGVAYLSSFPLLFASIIALALIRKEEETWELVFLFASAIVLSASCAAFFPAEGVFRYMNIASALANKLPMGSGIYHLATLGSVDEFKQVAGGSDLDHAEEAFGELVVSGGDRAIDLEMTKHALDTIAFLVESAVVDDRLLTVGSSRDDGVDPAAT